MEKLIKMDNVIVVDVDDVLFYTTSLWFDRIVKCEELKQFLKPNIIPENYDYYTHFMYNYSRPTYLFSEWLLRTDLTEEEKEVATNIIFDCILKNNFYNDSNLAPTRLVNTLNHIAKFSPLNIKKIIFVTRTLEGLEIEKLQLLKFYFANNIDKIEIILVERFEKKSDIVRNIKENVAMIFDDELSNIYDYIKNCENLKQTIFLIPETGYNGNFDEEIKKIAEEKEFEIKYYNYKD